MRSKRSVFVGLLVLLGLLIASPAIAEIVFDALQELPPATPPVAVIAAVSTIDQSNYDSPIRPKKVQSNAKVVFAPTFSAAGATATFEIVLYHRAMDGTNTFWTIAGPITITAKSTYTVGGRYPATSENVLPTLGAQVYDVRLLSISSGNVTWTSAAVGCDTRTASTASE